MAVQVNLHPEDFSNLEEICHYVTQVRGGITPKEHPTFEELESVLRFLKSFPEYERQPGASSLLFIHDIDYNCDLSISIGLDEVSYSALPPQLQ